MPKLTIRLVNVQKLKILRLTKTAYPEGNLTDLRIIH